METLENTTEGHVFIYPKSLNMKRSIAYWLATCAWNSKVPSASPAASYVQR